MELQVSGQIVRVVLADTYRTDDIDYLKHVTGLDRSLIRRGGYAYEGNFVSGETDLPEGALIIKGTSTGYGRRQKKYMQLFKVASEGLVPVEGPHMDSDGSTCVNKHSLSFFDFVEHQMEVVAAPARIKDLDSYTDRELLMELSRRGYLTIREATDLMETMREGYKPELPPSVERCRKILVTGLQCSRRARTGEHTCWQHPIKAR